MDTQKIPRLEILEDDDDEVIITHSSRKGSTKKTAISVEQYDEDRDIQSALMASLSHDFINLDDYYDDDELLILNFVPQNTPFGKAKKPFSSRSVTEKGQCSNSKNEVTIEERIETSFICDICVESKSTDESFSIKGCSHSYCNECMTKYVASKLQENITSINCPVADCKGVLEPEYCRDILPEDVFNRWGNALCEAVILGAQKFYCPFKDCSALLIDDGGEAIRESVCPDCNRMFCAQCKVPWHAGIQCAEFQKLHKDEREPEDIMLMTLAQKENWRRCPNCKIFVEKKEGCRYMRCRSVFSPPPLIISLGFIISLILHFKLF